MGVLSTNLSPVFTHPYSALWMAACNQTGQTVIARLSGVIPRIDQAVTCFVPAKFSRDMLSALNQNPNVAVVAASTQTFESYQFKGRYQSHRNATPEECEIQTQNLLAFSNAAALLKLPAEACFNAYFDDNFIALEILQENVYEQTPKEGTGLKIQHTL